MIAAWSRAPSRTGARHARTRTMHTCDARGCAPSHMMRAYPTRARHTLVCARQRDHASMEFATLKIGMAIHIAYSTYSLEWVVTSH